MIGQEFSRWRDEIAGPCTPASSGAYMMLWWSVPQIHSRYASPGVTAMAVSRWLQSVVRRHTPHVVRWRRLRTGQRHYDELFRQRDPTRPRQAGNGGASGVRQMMPLHPNTLRERDEYGKGVPSVAQGPGIKTQRSCTRGDAMPGASHRRRSIGEARDKPCGSTEEGGRYEDMEPSTEYLGMCARRVGRAKRLASHCGRC